MLKMGSVALQLNIGIWITYLRSVAKNRDLGDFIVLLSRCYVLSKVLIGLEGGRDEDFKLKHVLNSIVSIHYKISNYHFPSLKEIYST